MHMGRFQGRRSWRRPACLICIYIYICVYIYICMYVNNTGIYMYVCMYVCIVIRTESYRYVHILTYSDHDFLDPDFERHHILWLLEPLGLELASKPTTFRVLVNAVSDTLDRSI